MVISDSCGSYQKPDGYKLIDELGFWGFDLPTGVCMRLISGNYEGFTLNAEKDTFTFYIHGYYPITVYKSIFTSANTCLNLP